MFYSYRKFNKSSKKRVYILLLGVFILFFWCIMAYKGVKIVPKLITKELVIAK